MQCFIGISATNKFENHTFVIIHNSFTHVWLLWYEWEWTALVLEGNRSISIYYYDKHNNTWKLHAFTSRACWLQDISHRIAYLRYILLCTTFAHHVLFAGQYLSLMGWIRTNFNYFTRAVMGQLFLFKIIFSPFLLPMSNCYCL